MIPYENFGHCKIPLGIVIKFIRKVADPIPSHNTIAYQTLIGYPCPANKTLDECVDEDWIFDIPKEVMFGERGPRKISEV